MKRAVFVSKSRLCQNLMALIARSVPRRIKLTAVTDFNGLNGLKLTHSINTIILDENVLDEQDPTDVLAKAKLRTAKKILIHTRAAKIDRERLLRLGITHTRTKPFLPEEIVELLWDR